MEPLPMPDQLQESYEFTCALCGHEQLAAPSLFMTMGMNMGGGSCMNCDTSHHLEIDVETGAMFATPRDVWVELNKTPAS